MKNLLRIATFALLLVLGTAVAKAQSYVVINGNNVCIRSSASLSDNKIGHENKGARFQYMGTYGSFYCINYYGNYGYVHKSYSYISSPKTATTSQKFVKVCGYNVNIRRGPSKSSSVCGQANWGESFVYVGYTNGWYKIKYGGNTCYISSDYAKL